MQVDQQSTVLFSLSVFLFILLPYLSVRCLYSRIVYRYILLKRSFNRDSEYTYLTSLVSTVIHCNFQCNLCKNSERQKFIRSLVVLYQFCVNVSIFQFYIIWFFYLLLINKYVCLSLSEVWWFASTLVFLSGGLVFESQSEHIRPSIQIRL